MVTVHLVHLSTTQMGWLVYLQNLVLLLISPIFFLEEFASFELSIHGNHEVIGPLLLVQVFQTIHPFVA